MEEAKQTLSCHHAERIRHFFTVHTVASLKECHTHSLDIHLQKVSGKVKGPVLRNSEFARRLTLEDWSGVVAHCLLREM